jgi:hypothetical protein
VSNKRAASSGMPIGVRVVVLRSGLASARSLHAILDGWMVRLPTAGGWRSRAVTVARAGSCASTSATVRAPTDGNCAACRSSSTIASATSIRASTCLRRSGHPVASTVAVMRRAFARRSPGTPGRRRCPPKKKQSSTARRRSTRSAAGYPCTGKTRPRTRGARHQPSWRNASRPSGPPSGIPSMGRPSPRPLREPPEPLGRIATQALPLPNNLTAPIAGHRHLTWGHQ